MRVWLLLCCCAFKYDPGDDFFPLLGDPPALDGPRVTTQQPSAIVYLASDGRLWLLDFVIAPDGETTQLLRALETPSETVPLPRGARLLPEGILTPTFPDPTDHFHPRMELAVPGQPPYRRFDLSLFGGTDTPQVLRGPGYFLYAGTGGMYGSYHLIFDDGHEDVFDVSENSWGPFNTDASGLGERYLLLESGDYSTLAVYDLAAHTVTPLGPMPMQLNLQEGKRFLFPDLHFFYDHARDQFWIGWDHSYFSDLAAKSWIDLQSPAVDLRLVSDGTVLLQDPSGTVSRVHPDGAREALAHVDLFDLEVSHDQTFVYSKRGYDDYDSLAFAGWIGDRQIIRAGLHASFSADGKRLYWLEDATKNNSAGDLYSMDTASFRVRHLARNVNDYHPLPDGRLVALSDAALEGAWNRAIVIDEDKGECRWLGQGLQQVVVVGDRVVGIRHDGGSYTAFPLPLPPR